MTFYKVIILTVIAFFLFLLSSCAGPMQKGSYLIKQNNKEYKATAISVIDEEEKVKYKGEDGKIHTVEGSFEIYQR